jgi:hypothetical protein
MSTTLSEHDLEALNNDAEFLLVCDRPDLDEEAAKNFVRTYIGGGRVNLSNEERLEINAPTHVEMLKKAVSIVRYDVNKQIEKNVTIPEHLPNSNFNAYKKKIEEINSFADEVEDALKIKNEKSSQAQLARIYDNIENSPSDIWSSIPLKQRKNLTDSGVVGGTTYNKQAFKEAVRSLDPSREDRIKSNNEKEFTQAVAIALATPDKKKQQTKLKTIHDTYVKKDASNPIGLTESSREALKDKGWFTTEFETDAYRKEMEQFASTHNINTQQIVKDAEKQKKDPVSEKLNTSILKQAGPKSPVTNPYGGGYGVLGAPNSSKVDIDPKVEASRAEAIAVKNTGKGSTLVQSNEAAAQTPSLPSKTTEPTTPTTPLTTETLDKWDEPTTRERRKSPKH